MNKKKNIICTILFAIVIFSAWVSTFFIENEYCALYEIIAPWICGVWIGERIGKFYEWLSK